jgi:hypothetical protein
MTLTIQGAASQLFDEFSTGFEIVEPRKVKVE